MVNSISVSKSPKERKKCGRGDHSRRRKRSYSETGIAKSKIPGTRALCAEATVSLQKYTKLIISLSRTLENASDEHLNPELRHGQVIARDQNPPPFL